jgi:hypothetical protein
MQLFNSSVLPTTVVSWIVPVLNRFDFLNDDQPVAAIAYYVTPVGGDVSYIIFRHGAKNYVLVAADHPDPESDGKHLQNLSKKYQFGNIITTAGESVSVKDITTDKFLDDFFVKDESIYYYCVEIWTTSTTS